MTVRRLYIASPSNQWLNPDRPEACQARVLETIIRAVDDLRAELGVTHWELFTLRDADSAKDDLLHRFGIMRDDYTPKPAYYALRDVIAELTKRRKGAGVCARARLSRTSGTAVPRSPASRIITVAGCETDAKARRARRSA